MNNKKIGVFDSGIGGLTALSALKKEFPNEDFIYVADNKNCPYGEKTKEELEKIVLSIIKYFESIDVKMIIIACNTASANSYDIKSSIPIIRIIKPTATQALKNTGRIGVLGTDYTIMSKAYNKFLPEMIGIKCSPFVRVIESGNTNTTQSFKIAEDILSPYKNKVDIAILGCTHFSLMEEEIKKTLGDIKIVDSSKSLGNDVSYYLDIVGRGENKGRIIFRYTGSSDINMSWFKEKIDKLEKIKV